MELRMSEDILLAIDTCGAAGGVALGTVLAEDAGQIRIIANRELAGKTYSARLVPEIRRMLDEAGVKPAALRGVIVVNGPGSFTGIRIGVSAAKALAEALQIPVIALSRLALLEEVAADAGLPPGAAVFAALDAGRSEYYARIGGREELIPRDELVVRAAETGAEVACCDESVAVALNAVRLRRVPAPTAADALDLAAKRWRARSFDNVETLDANYLRRSDAEIFSKPATAATVPR